MEFNNFLNVQVITGLLRLRNDNKYHKVVPVGILPLGKTNSLANDLYAFNTNKLDKLFRFHVIMDATYSIIREITKPLNVMEIRNIDVEDVSDQLEFHETIKFFEIYIKN